MYNSLNEKKTQKTSLLVDLYSNNVRCRKK